MPTPTPPLRPETDEGERTTGRPANANSAASLYQPNGRFQLDQTTAAITPPNGAGAEPATSVHTAADVPTLRLMTAAAAEARLAQSLISAGAAGTAVIQMEAEAAAPAPAAPAAVAVAATPAETPRRLGTQPNGPVEPPPTTPPDAATPPPQTVPPQRRLSDRSTRGCTRMTPEWPFFLADVEPPRGLPQIDEEGRTEGEEGDAGAENAAVLGEEGGEWLRRQRQRNWY